MLASLILRRSPAHILLGLVEYEAMVFPINMRSFPDVSVWQHWPAEEVVDRAVVTVMRLVVALREIE
jgi:hypothetical protein